MSAVTPGSARAWVLAARPATLTAAWAPVAVGAAVAYAEGGFRLGPVAASLFGAMAIQVGTNFANDVFDYEKGADTAERLGPTRAVQAGLLRPSAVRWGMVFAFLSAILSGVYLVSVAGPTIVVIGLVSILSGIAYTAGPYPLAYQGLGDLFVFVFFGLVAVAGTTFVQTGEWSSLAFIAAIPVGAWCTNVLVVNNLRDRHQDVKANKRTLAVRFGRTFGVTQYWVLMLGAYAVVLVLALQRGLGLLLPFVTLPWALKLGRSVARDEGPVLNQTLASTARLLLVASVLLSIGLVLRFS